METPRKSKAETGEIAIVDPELITLMEVLDGMNDAQLKEYKAKMLYQISDREQMVRMINDVLDGNGVI